MSSLTRIAALAVLALLTAVALAAPDTGHAAADPAADAAHAAGDHAGHEKVGAIPTPEQGAATGVTALVVFALAAGFLGAVVWPKLTVALDERANKIRSEIAAAEEARRQAREALEEYESNLAQARAEAQKMLEETRAQQAALAAELKAKADAELSAMRDKARIEIETAKKQALAEIYAETVNLATTMAGKILKREVSVADQQRLMEESLAEMKAVNA
ncbi:MAG: ATP synthase F0 subunit B [Planctomycetota bacterium]|nr:MAG: ATP synthase F0 subunit B [Planctomycetota bacterium]